MGTLLLYIYTLTATTMYENVNKAHPYIEKELEGIETYD